MRGCCCKREGGRDFELAYGLILPLLQLHALVTLGLVMTGLLVTL